MYSVTIISHDRVVTAARLNNGAESLCGLTADDIRTVEIGFPVYLKSRRPPTATVRLSMPLETWDFEGQVDSMPDLESSCFDDKKRKIALHAWADSATLVMIFLQYTVHGNVSSALIIPP